MKSPAGSNAVCIAIVLFAIMSYWTGLRLEQTLPETIGIFLFFILVVTLLFLYAYIKLFIKIGKRGGIYRISELLFPVSFFVLFLAVIGVGFSLLWIRHDIKTQCIQAKKEYHADCVTALLQLAEDTKRSYYARNNAIWALGQLGDIRALPIVKTMYTGTIPNREPYNKMLSQYEIYKSIRLLSGEINVGAIVWRHGIE